MVGLLDTENLEYFVLGDQELLMGVIDKHAPIRSRQISNKNSPWVTNELRRLMYKRDYLKKAGYFIWRPFHLGVNIGKCEIIQIMK